MVNGYSNFVREVAQRQTFSPLPAQNEFNVVDDVALLRADDAWSRERCCFVCRSHDLVEQTHNRLFNHQWLFHRPGHNLLEKPPLGEICGRVSPAAREVERSVRMRVKAESKVRTTSCTTSISTPNQSQRSPSMLTAFLR